MVIFSMLCIFYLTTVFFQSFYEVAVLQELSYYIEQGVSMPDNYFSSQEVVYHSNKVLVDSFNSLLTWLPEGGNLTSDPPSSDALSFQKVKTHLHHTYHLIFRYSE